MPEGEQKRIFALLPPVRQVTVKAAPGSTTLKVGRSARFRVTTTVVGKPISVTTAAIAPRPSGQVNRPNQPALGSLHCSTRSVDDGTLGGTRSCTSC